MKTYFYFIALSLSICLVSSCTGQGDENKIPSECEYYLNIVRGSKTFIQNSNNNPNIRQFNLEVGSRCTDFSGIGVRVNESCKNNLLNEFKETHNCQ